MEFEANDLAKVSAQFADPARAKIVMNLMDGSSRSAGELGLAANVSPSSASGHLSKLVSSGILTGWKVGRQKYYRIATTAVAHAVEALLTITSSATPLRNIARSSLNPFAFARTCYDHLAGKLGVEITLALEREHIIRSTGNDFEITHQGFEWLQELKIDEQKLRLQKRAFAPKCLDFTERRPHLAGALGSALCARWIDLGWLVKTRLPRSVRLTDEGRKEFSKELHIVFTADGIQRGGFLG